MKLLYAEDEETMAEAVVDILTYHNYLVDTVADGAEALAYAQNGDYDGIILDVMMPKMDGLEVLSRLREMGCRTPILLLTAKGAVEDRVAGLDLGADDYLPKPFVMEEFLARMRSKPTSTSATAASYVRTIASRTASATSATRRVPMTSIPATISVLAAARRLRCGWSVPIAWVSHRTSCT